MVFLKTKERRKQAKYKDILYKLHGIILQNLPTQNLAICNGGLTNGLSEERILEVLEPHGKIMAVILPPRESIAFIQYEAVEGACAAFTNVTGMTWPGGGPAFLAYVDKLPACPNFINIFSPPPGLMLLEDFITDAEEDSLVKCLCMEEASSNLKHRTVKHYGFEFQYSNNRADLTPIEPIPTKMSFLWARLSRLKNIDFEPDQCTVNLYTPGDGIPPHVDTHSAFTEYIVSLSLLSDIVMDWKREKETRNVLLCRKSLCVMSGESRYAWTHGITPRKNDVIPSTSNGLTLRPRSTRISLTFRRTKCGPCKCVYSTLCDTALDILKSQSNEVTNETAANLEFNSVHKVYDEIADHFCETRLKPWPKIGQFLNSFPVGSLLLDVGCGSGRYLNSRTDACLLGCDRSGSLLSLCHAAGHSVFLCDCLQIPVRDGIMDGCICIAVIHHLSTEKRRTEAITEIMRVLRPGGRALIYVWAKDQEADTSKSSYLKQMKKTKQSEPAGEPSLASVSQVTLPVHTNRTNFQHSDVFVPWQLKPDKSAVSGPLFLRYYHVFDNFELKTVAERVLGAVCLDYYYDQGNWCIMLKKAVAES